MVVDYLDIFRSRLLPAEANPVLIIHADAVLALPLAGQLLQQISRRDPQVLDGRCYLELSQLTACNFLYINELLYPLAARE